MDGESRASTPRLKASKSSWRRVRKRDVLAALAIAWTLAGGADAAGAPEYKYLNYTGDIVLGALFPVHGRGRGGSECGRIQKEVGVQPLEAMLFTLQQINNSTTLLPGIKLGMLAFDTCDSSSYGLEQSLNFAKALIAHQNEFHHVHEFQCSDGTTPKFREGVFDKVVAVIGAQSSSVTVQVATLLQLFNVPQVSYMATSPALSNKERFPYFFRTVPSDINRAHAMLEILRKFNWTYVSVVHSDDTYGNHGFKILSDLAANYSICFSSSHRIESEERTQQEVVLREMSRKANLKVVVVFADKKTMQDLLTTAGRMGLKNRFLWIVSDIWVANEKVRGSAGNSPYTEMPNYEYETVLDGALAIQPLVAELTGFDSYFRSLNLDHEAENPWFEEYWMDYFNCSKKYKDNDHIEANEAVDKGAGADCRGDRTLGSGPYRQQYYLHFVRDAVYSVARALGAMHDQLCHGVPGLCAQMRHIDGEQLRSYLRRVSFRDEEGNNFEFLEGGDGPPRYSILNFQKSSDGNFYWRVVGNYTQTGNSDPVLIINEKSVVYQNNGTLPTFSCTQPCAHNQIKVLEFEERCCWSCRRCGEFEFRSDDFTCETCPLGTRPSADHAHCVDIPEEFVDSSSPWALTAMCFAGVGIVLTLVVATVYWTYGDTPVIKASGRELSYLLLAGIFTSFCTTFAIVARPSAFACGLARFLVGFCLALCYAAVVTKTNRIARIFAQQRAHAMYKLRYTSPQSQLVITGLLTLVEVVINLSWLIFIPPQAIYIYPDRSSRVLICEGFKNHSCLVALLYPFILVVICTVYAFQTRKCPDGFNETKHIAFTNYTTIIIWLAFVPFYLASTSNSIRITSLAFSSSMSGLVQLTCLFFPKLYIVLLKPRKNTRDGVMANHRSVICLPEPRVSGCSCSRQGSSKNSEHNHSGSTQDNKNNSIAFIGNKLATLYQSRAEDFGAKQPTEVKSTVSGGIQDGVL